MREMGSGGMLVGSVVVVVVVVVVEEEDCVTIQILTSRHSETKTAAVRGGGCRTGPRLPPDGACLRKNETKSGAKCIL